MARTPHLPASLERRSRPGCPGQPAVLLGRRSALPHAATCTTGQQRGFSPAPAMHSQPSQPTACSAWKGARHSVLLHAPCPARRVPAPMLAERWLTLAMSIPWRWREYRGEAGLQLRAAMERSSEAPAGASRRQQAMAGASAAAKEAARPAGQHTPPIPPCGRILTASAPPPPPRSRAAAATLCPVPARWRRSATRRGRT
jgi:hypothetical protein